jgi:hypothetical protein
MDYWQQILGTLLLAVYIVLIVLNLRRTRLMIALASFDIITWLIAGIYLIIASFL